MPLPGPRIRKECEVSIYVYEDWKKKFDIGKTGLNREEMMPPKAVGNLMATCHYGANAPPSTPFLAANIQLKLQNPDNRDIRTLPELVEFNVVHNGDFLFCLQAGRQQNLQPITHRQLKEAILCCSDWLVANVKEVKPPTIQESVTIEKSKPVALLMESDVGL